MIQGELWAVPFEKIYGFFEELPGIKTTGSGRYEFGDTKILVFRMPEKKAGPLLLPQTKVLWEGTANEELEKAFCLRFLSAGG